MSVRTHKPKNASRIDRTVGARIQELRTATGMTRQDLAAKLNITQQQLQKYEKGVNRITVSRLAKIAEILRTPITDFLSVSVQPVIAGEGQRSTLTLMRCFSAIKSPRIRRALIELLALLARRGA